MWIEDMNSYLHYPQIEKNQFIVSLINGISKHQIFLIHSFSYYLYFYLQSLTNLKQRKKYIVWSLFYWWLAEL